jgi:hypothetical protein
MSTTLNRHLTAFALSAALVMPASAQDRPLPDSAPFLANARAHLKTDRTLLTQYTYLERRRQIHLSKLAKVEPGPEQVFEVYPGLTPDETYRRLIETGGKRRDPKELEQSDATHRAHVLDQLRQRDHESAADRERRVQRAEKELRDEQLTIEDVFRVLTFTLTARQLRDGRETIVVEFAPQPNAVPRTDNGRIMKKVKGRAWVSEDDYEVAGVEVEMLEDLSLGLFLGKLYKGTTASFTRVKINNEVWLPAEAHFHGLGRALVRKFSIDTVVQYSAYQKFSVNTDTVFTTPR